MVHTSRRLGAVWLVALGLGACTGSPSAQPQFHNVATGVEIVRVVPAAGCSPTPQDPRCVLQIVVRRFSAGAPTDVQLLVQARHEVLRNQPDRVNPGSAGAHPTVIQDRVDYWTGGAWRSVAHHRSGLLDEVFRRVRTGPAIRFVLGEHQQRTIMLRLTERDSAHACSPDCDDEYSGVLNVQLFSPGNKGVGGYQNLNANLWVFYGRGMCLSYGDDENCSL